MTSSKEVTPLIAFERGFTKHMGAANACCFGCATLSISVQVIDVLVILNAVNHLMTFYGRSGAPCFFCERRSRLFYPAGASVRSAASQTRRHLPQPSRSRLSQFPATDRDRRLFTLSHPL